MHFHALVTLFIGTFEVIYLQQVLKVPHCLSTLRMSHEMYLSVFAPPSWNAVRVSQHMLTVSHALQILWLIVSIDVMLMHMSFAIDLLRHL